MGNLSKLFRSTAKANLFLLFVCLSIYASAQKYDYKTDSAWQHAYKNVVRYNVSGAMLFGADKFVIFGYERVLSPHRSFSINFGKVAFPKIAAINTDSFNLSKNQSTSGYNISVDYRFYLPNENKHFAPRGIYIGPYYSYNHFERENQWDYKNANANSYVKTNTKFDIHTVGFELGYQFIFWKRLSLDLVMIGPGVGFYDLGVKFDSNIDAETKEQLLDGLKQLLTQKFPGMNFVFADKEINSNGALRTTSLGYRYMIHIGFNF